jgi:glycerol-3-phosphate dehydrogenase
MNQLAVHMGANPLTLAGLSGSLSDRSPLVPSRLTRIRDVAGMGDLILTCYGSLSRNRGVGQRLGRGETLDAILASMTEVRLLFLLTLDQDSDARPRSQRACRPHARR